MKAPYPFIFTLLLTAIMPAGMMAGASGDSADGDGFDAQLKFETREIRLGEIHGSDPDRPFSFTGVNTGNAPLVLTYVHPSCNCVRLQYPREPIAPGDTLRISGRLNPHGLSGGPFRRDIIVRSNATEPKIRLLLTGTVAPDSIH